MSKVVVICMLYCMWTVSEAQDYYYQPNNVTRSTLSGFAAYRSALTLDWLAAEDSQQRELAFAFETHAPSARFISTDCTAYPKPAPGKVARLMLELLKNLEGDDGVLISELVQVLVRTNLLVETSILDSEPDFEALVKTPGVMVGEPHSTLPRIVAAVWILVSDPVSTRKYGWCPVKKVNKYLHVSKPRDIAREMKALEVIVARARFVMEEFIQNITPINMYQRKPQRNNTPKQANNANKQRRLERRPPGHRMENVHQLAAMQSASSSSVDAESIMTPSAIDGVVIVGNRGSENKPLEINCFVFFYVFSLLKADVCIYVLYLFCHCDVTLHELDIES